MKIIYNIHKKRLKKNRFYLFICSLVCSNTTCARLWCSKFHYTNFHSGLSRLSCLGDTFCLYSDMVMGLNLLCRFCDIRKYIRMEYSRHRNNNLVRNQEDFRRQFQCLQGNPCPSKNIRVGGCWVWGNSPCNEFSRLQRSILCSTSYSLIPWTLLRPVARSAHCSGI